MALSTIASKQAKTTKITLKNVHQVLDDLATKQDATIKFHASDMVLNIHSDESYLSTKNAKSRASGNFFLGSEPITFNGAIFTFCTILKFVASSAPEAELGAIFMNLKEGRTIRLTLEDLGHPQPPIPIHCDNVTVAGISNITIKKQRSLSMEMQYFYVCDQVKHKQYDVIWHPGQEKLGDYTRKHHLVQNHMQVRPIYFHMNNSQIFLPRAMIPRDLRECVGKSTGRYIWGRPLHIIPRFIL